VIGYLIGVLALIVAVGIWGMIVIHRAYYMPPSDVAWITEMIFEE
jgi:hypothetical protein